MPSAAPVIRAGEIIPRMLGDRLKYECGRRGFALPGAVVTVRRDPVSDITVVRYEVPGHTPLNVPLIGDLNELAFVEIVPKIAKTAADFFAKGSPARPPGAPSEIPLPAGVWSPPT